MIIHNNVAPPLAAAVVIAIGIAIGLANGLIVARAGLNAFITTLATGIVVQGFTQLYTDGASVFGAMPSPFLYFGRGRLFGVPLAFLYVLVIAAIMSVIYTYTRWGRQSFAIGGNARAAYLVGIPVDRVTIQSFVVAGALSSIAGVLSCSILGSANPNIGINYLLPAFAAVFLGG